MASAIVTVIGPRGRADLSVADDVPITTLMPRLLEACGEQADAEGWTLVATGNRPLTLAGTLTGCGVEAGAILELRPAGAAAASVAGSAAWWEPPPAGAGGTAGSGVEDTPRTPGGTSRTDRPHSAAWIAAAPLRVLRRLDPRPAFGALLDASPAALVAGGATAVGLSALLVVALVLTTRPHATTGVAALTATPSLQSPGPPTDAPAPTDIETATPSPSPSPTATPVKSTPSPTPQPTPAPPPCLTSTVQETISTDRKTYAAGQLVTVSLVARNASTLACALPSGAAVSIQSDATGATAWQGSTGTPNGALWEPGGILTAQFSWPQTACSGGATCSTPAAPAALGSYTVQGRWNGFALVANTFTITAAPTTSTTTSSSLTTSAHTTT